MAVKRSQGGDRSNLEMRRRSYAPWLMAGTCVVLSALLTIPRPVDLRDVPTPRVNWLRVREAELERRRLVAAAVEKQLPFEVRVVGELLRQLGRAEAERKSTTASEELASAVRRALAEIGAEPLAQLQALQAHLFVLAVQSWRPGQPPSAELIELGGSFATRAAAAGWIDPAGSGLPSSQELSALYRIRWASVTGLLQTPGFEPSVDDWRLYYGFRLRQPEGASPRDRRLTQLANVDGLKRFDEDYPADYAKGVVHWRMGAAESALTHFRRHLAESPSGRFSLRARNGAAAAAAAMSERR